MAGTVKGGKLAAKTNTQKYGTDYYTRLGYLGGKASKGGGFANNRELASRAGKLGGAKSKRRPGANTSYVPAGPPYLPLRGTHAERLAKKAEAEVISEHQTQKLSKRFGKQRPW